MSLETIQLVFLRLLCNGSSENFPKDPFVILDPNERWFPADESLRETSAEKLLPPLVSEIRKQVDVFRKSDYEGASETSRSLLNGGSRQSILLREVVVEKHLIITLPKGKRSKV